MAGGCDKVPNTTPDSIHATEFSRDFLIYSILALLSYSRFSKLLSESNFSCSTKDTEHLISFWAIEGYGTLQEVNVTGPVECLRSNSSSGVSYVLFFLHNTLPASYV